MRVTTASARRVVVQAASVSLLCMLAYRCVRQLRENSVTVYVTELVRLPPAATTLPAAMTATTTTARTKTKNDKAAAADSDDDSHQTSTAAAFAAAAALTTQSSSSSRHHHRRHRHGSAAAAAALVLTTVAVEGVVEVRTRLTRGYCFALKLCASWAEQDDMSVYGSDSAAAITAAASSTTATGASATRHGSRGRRRHRASVSRNSNNSNRHTVPTYSLRRRAVQTAAAVMRRPHTPVVPALARAIRRDSDSDSDSSHNVDDSSSSSDGSNNSSDDDDDTRVSSPLPTAATATTTAQQGRHGRASRAHVAVLRALRVHAMVDRYELAEKGLLCFAPACVSSTTLLAYRTSARIALPHRQPHTTAAAAAAAQAATVIVHGCYLQADGSTPTAQRLSLDVRFTGALHDVQVQLTLPHARCRVRCAYTCGVGTLRQRIDGMSAARCIWQLGDVDENTCRDNATHGGGAVASGRNNNNNESYTTTAAAHAARTHDADAGANNDDALALYGAAASLHDARERVCHFVLVYEPPTTNDNDDDDDNTNEVAAAASADDDDDNSSGSDVVGSDNDDDDDATAIATATQASSSRARKRAARAQQRRRVHERQQRLRAGLVAGSGSGRRDGSEASRLPRVELRYRVPTLASGAVVRRLQVLEQHTDDDGSSDADKTRSTPPLLLRRLLSWLCHRRTSAAATATVTQQRQHGRLTKLAHYTTCYVQPIVVTPL